jgi:hypothetical protein
VIKHGKHTSLVPIRKRTPDKRKHRDDKLGMDTDQYTHEIPEAELIPFIKSLPGGVLSLRCRARRWCPTIFDTRLYVESGEIGAVSEST